MKAYLNYALAAAVLAGCFSGCSDTAKVQQKTTTSTPGGTTTTTTTQEVEKSGSNPPPARP